MNIFDKATKKKFDESELVRRIWNPFCSVPTTELFGLLNLTVRFVQPNNKKFLYLVRFSRPISETVRLHEAKALNLFSSEKYHT